MSERLKAVVSKDLERQEKSQKNREYALLGFVGLLVIVALTALAYWFSNNLKTTDKSSSSIETYQIANEAYEPVSQVEQDLSDVSRDVVRPQNTLPSRSGDAQQDFEALFEAYQSDYSASMQELAQLPWSATKVSKIVSRITQASELYANEEFKSGIDALGSAIKQAQALLEEQEANVNRILNKIETAFGAGSQAGITQGVAALQSVSPNHPAIAKIQQSQQILPAVMELSGNIKRYAAENRPELELDALRQLSKISDLTPAQKERVQNLELVTARNTVDSILSKARSALNQKDVTQAQNFLNQAAKYPQGAGEAQVLQSRLNALNIELAVSRNLSAAQKYVNTEQWSDAARSYSAVLAVDSTNQAAQDGLAQASSIDQLLSKQASLLSRPLRVSDAKVKSYAQDLVADSTDWLGVSAQLARSVDALNTVLVKVNKKKAVRFLSDGKSTIQIQRVGYIQPTLEKIVELNPGEYKVFATCNKKFETVTDLLVPLDGEVQPIKVVCGEGI